MADISLAAALAASPPPVGASPKALDLWEKLQVRIAEHSALTSHAQGDGGAAYTKNVPEAERLILKYYEAYLMAISTIGTVAGTNPMLLREPAGWTFDYRRLCLDQL